MPDGYRVQASDGDLIRYLTLGSRYPFAGGGGNACAFAGAVTLPNWGTASYQQRILCQPTYMTRVFHTLTSQMGTITLHGYTSDAFSEAQACWPSNATDGARGVYHRVSHAKRYPPSPALRWVIWSRAGLGSGCLHGAAKATPGYPHMRFAVHGIAYVMPR